MERRSKNHWLSHNQCSSHSGLRTSNFLRTFPDSISCLSPKSKEFLSQHPTQLKFKKLPTHHFSFLYSKSSSSSSIDHLFFKLKNPIIPHVRHTKEQKAEQKQVVLFVCCLYVVRPRNSLEHQSIQSPSSHELLLTTYEYRRHNRIPPIGTSFL